MFFDLVVQIHNMQNIKKLTFVLMETFYLNVKDRARINFNSIMLFNIFCKTYFVLVFNLHKLTSGLFVVRKRSELFNLRQICDPSISDLICNPVCQKRVSVCEESSLCDAVCLVTKFFRHHLIEITELLCFQDICMQLRNAVYRKSRDNSHICHANLTVS